MKNSHTPLSDNFESNLTFLLHDIHAVTKISFSLFDKEFHLLSSLSGWENHISNFFFLNCPFAILFFRHTTFELVYLSTYRFRIFSRIRTGF